MTDLITVELVDLDLVATDKDAAARSLGERLLTAGRVSDLEQFLSDIRAREQQMATGIEGGIGIPHCRSEAVLVPTLGFGRSTAGIDFGAEDGPAHLVFLIAAPAGGGSDHMTILAKLARKLVSPSFTQRLHSASVPQDVVDTINTEVLGQ